MEHHSIIWSVSQTVSVGVCVSHSFIIHWRLLSQQIPLTAKWGMSGSPHSLWSPMCELLSTYTSACVTSCLKWCYISYSPRWLVLITEKNRYCIWCEMTHSFEVLNDDRMCPFTVKNRTSPKQFNLPIKKSQNTAATVF